MNNTDAPITKGRKKDGTFEKGFAQPGAGRPKGSRHRLQEDFVKALADDFSEHGVIAISDMRAKDPAAYIKTIASLMPKQVELNETLELIGDAELVDVVTALRSALNSGQAGSGDKQESKGKQAKGLPAIH